MSPKNNNLSCLLITSNLLPRQASQIRVWVCRWVISGVGAGALAE
jgi:hypothetical protein